MIFKDNIPIRKSWGQNFIIDQNTINKIISIIDPNKNDIIFEIGPGKGALTIPLSNIVSQINTVEIDPLLVQYLKNENITNFSIINQNILDTNLNKFNNSTKAIGNLPYYITSPILFKMLIKTNIKKMIFMVQKEVAERIVANNSNKNFSRISVMIQTFFNVELKCNISNNVFFPKPKVDSSIITLNRKTTDLDINKYSIFIKESFKQKRKKLKNNLKTIINLEGLKLIGDRRAENITKDEYIKIFKNYML